MNLLVLHGPNLNMLGKREPEIYGKQTLSEINHQLYQAVGEHQLSIIQSQSESVLIEAIHQAYLDDVAGIVINPASLTHTSIAIRDALLATQIPFFEVHLSNIYSRETFRHKSYISDIAIGVISGLGAQGYIFALDYLIKKIESC